MIPSVIATNIRTMSSERLNRDPDVTSSNSPDKRRSNEIRVEIKGANTTPKKHHFRSNESIVDSNPSLKENGTPPPPMTSPMRSERAVARRVELLRHRSRCDSSSSTAGQRRSMRDLRRQSSLSLHHWNDRGAKQGAVPDDILDALKKEGVPWWTSKRMMLAVICFCGFFCLYANRVNLSIAIVCMVKFHLQKTEMMYALNTTNSSQTHEGLNVSYSLHDIAKETRICPVSEIKSTTSEGEFDWDKPLNGLILGAFFWGYTVMQIPGGWLAERFGPRKSISFGMLLVSVLTLVTPLMARASPYCLLVGRVIIGVGEAFMYPGAQVLWSKWSPPDERSRLVGFSFGGCQVGNALTFPIASLLCEYGFDGGWPSIFYILGGLNLIWCCVWVSIVRNEPSEMPGISPLEKKYINLSLGHVTSDLPRKSHPQKARPWKAILLSPAVWAISVANFCGNFGAYMLLTQMPTYMKEILHFDIKQNGLYSMIPYLVFWVFILLSGQFADFLISRDLLNIEWTRKLCCAIGMFVPGIFLVAVGYMDCWQQTTAVVLLTLSLGFCGFQFSSFFVNHSDIAPAYAGTIFGITNTWASIPGILASYIVSAITVNKTVGEWQIAFYLAAGVYCIGAIFFIIFAKGRVLPWASEEEEDTYVGEVTSLKPVDEGREENHGGEATHAV